MALIKLSCMYFDCLENSSAVLRSIRLENRLEIESLLRGYVSYILFFFRLQPLSVMDLNVINFDSTRFLIFLRVFDDGIYSKLQKHEHCT